MIRPGLHIYLGTTGIGKTYKAFNDLQEYHASTKLGALIIDSGGARNFRHLEHLRSPTEVVRAVWVEKRIVAWTPRDEFEFERMMGAIEAGGGIIVLIDEIGFWPNSPGLRRLCRIWRHREVTILLTAQHIGKDIGQVLLGCNPVIYVFRTTAPRSLEWLEDWHDLDGKTVRAQEIGVYVEKEF